MSFETAAMTRGLRPKETYCVFYGNKNRKAIGNGLRKVKSMWGLEANVSRNFVVASPLSRLPEKSLCLIELESTMTQYTTERHLQPGVASTKRSFAREFVGGPLLLLVTISSFLSDSRSKFRGGSRTRTTRVYRDVGEWYVSN
jgi:hypothetical protein